MQAQTTCFDPSEARRIEGEENAPMLKDPMPCLDCDGTGDGGSYYPDGDPQRETDVPCERCKGRGEIDWSDYSEDEQVEHLQAEVDMLRKRLEPVPLFDDLQFDADTNRATREYLSALARAKHMGDKGADKADGDRLAYYYPCFAGALQALLCEQIERRLGETVDWELVREFKSKERAGGMTEHLGT